MHEEPEAGSSQVPFGLNPVAIPHRKHCAVCVPQTAQSATHKAAPPSEHERLPLHCAKQSGTQSPLPAHSD